MAWPLWTSALALGAARLAVAVAVERRRRRAPALPPPLPLSPCDVTILLPVRDEESNVLPCLESLLAQTVRPAVRVIDDGSSDRSAELVAARAAGEPRLILVSAGRLPGGWLGKVHALWVGARDVRSPWILLTDADTRHHPELLARTCAAAAKEGLDAVSLAGSQEVGGWGENLLVPAVFALLDALLGDWEAAARSDGPPVANGQYLLLRRTAWESCGGFEAVRAEPSDDVAMARLLAARGFRCGFFRAPGLLRVRMYRGGAAAAHGWRRNLGGLFGRRPLATAAVLAFLLLPAIAIAALAGSGHPAAAALLWSAGAAASALLRAGSEHSPWYGLLFPLDDLVLAWLLARGVRDVRRGRLIAWKGREISLAR